MLPLNVSYNKKFANVGYCKFVTVYIMVARVVICVLSARLSCGLSVL